MGKKDELERLHQQAQSLEKSISGIDHEIERATHDLAAGNDPGQLISFLQKRHNMQLGFMYDLGRVEAKIEDLENLIREEQERPQERLLTDQLQEASPVSREDHLDWFKQSLIENPPVLDGLDRAEQQMLHEMEREPTPDDHLDWLSGRR